MKKCTTCHTEKPTSEFPPKRRKCKTCVAEYLTKWKQRNPYKIREYGLLKDFGISHDEYMKLHDSQNGLCAICNKPETAFMKTKTMFLAVDHDHATGEVRGLLCTNCNNGLGRFNDNIELLQKAIQYIEKSRPEGRP